MMLPTRLSPVRAMLLSAVMHDNTSQVQARQRQQITVLHAANIAITNSDVSTYSADPSNVLHYNYVITRTWRATDVAGNYSECIQTITVHDVTARLSPARLTSRSAVMHDNTPAGTGTATATDNCAPAANIAITNSDVSTYSADPARCSSL